jgi:predicted 3-demethylubiquinone-9 3-methyltransferase (glyoxalase superfamily)
MRYEKGEEPDREGSIKHVSLWLEGKEFAAMDSMRMHDIKFNEAVSFLVHCETQQEIDYYWDRLTAIPEAEQFGWLK